MRLYVLGCIALLGLACAGVLADEFSWTRQTWTQHTLDFPWVAFREQARRVEERGLTTLEGPHADLPEYLRAAENSYVYRGVYYIDLHSRRCSFWQMPPCS